MLKLIKTHKAIQEKELQAFATVQKSITVDLQIRSKYCTPSSNGVGEWSNMLFIRYEIYHHIIIYDYVIYTSELKVVGL